MTTDPTPPFADHSLDLVNLPEAPPVTVKGETDARAAALTLARLLRRDNPPLTLDEAADEVMACFARRAALVPDAEAVPVAWQWFYRSKSHYGWDHIDKDVLDRLLAISRPDYLKLEVGQDYRPVFAASAQRAPDASASDNGEDGKTVWSDLFTEPLRFSDLGRAAAYALMGERRDPQRDEVSRWQMYLPWVRRYMREMKEHSS